MLEARAGCRFCFTSCAPGPPCLSAIVRIMKQFEYILHNKPDGTRFIIRSKRPLSMHEQLEKFEEFMKGRIHDPTPLPKRDIIVFEDTMGSVGESAP